MATITPVEQSATFAVDYGTHQVQVLIVNTKISKLSLIKNGIADLVIDVTPEIELLVQGIQDYQAYVASITPPTP